jgi:hypothetical protein
MSAKIYGTIGRATLTDDDFFLLAISLFLHLKKSNIVRIVQQHHKRDVNSRRRKFYDLGRI